MADDVAMEQAGDATHAPKMPGAALEEVQGRITQAIAALLSPTFTAVVDRTVSACIDQIRREMRE